MSYQQKDRLQFLEEIKLRESIRKCIQEIKIDKRLSLLEEHNTRKLIKKLIQEAEVSDKEIHETTGINVLEDLLKKIIPALEKDYKILTTDKAQRDSFRSHIINAIENTIAPSKTRDQPDEEKLISISESMEEDLTMTVGDEEKFIDIDPKTDPKQQEKEEFGIENEDTTGRNMALITFKKIEKNILDSYDLLDNNKDAEVFYDYLITNLKLYFDRFEEELQSTLQEPTTSEYEEEKDEQDIKSF